MDISIHHMLLLSTYPAIKYGLSLDFNTSYVVIKQHRFHIEQFLLYNFNTSYVVIKRYWYWDHIKGTVNFNTSYVVIKLNWRWSIITTLIFQYIICCY